MYSITSGSLRGARPSITLRGTRASDTSGSLRGARPSITLRGTRSSDTGARGTVCVRQALQEGEVDRLLNAGVVRRVQHFEALRAATGGQVVHGGAHSVGPAPSEPGARVRTATLPALLF